MTDSSTNDSLLTRLNNLIKATTALVNGVNITEDEINALIGSIKENSDTAVVDRYSIMNDYNKIKDLLDNTKGVLNDTIDKVYSNSMTFDPTPSKSPIANYNGHIHHKLLNPISIPPEDYSLPLKDNLYLSRGKGYPVQMDASQAQNGTVMIDVPNLYTAKGETTFNDDGLEVTKGLILSDDLMGRTVSSELGEVEYCPANPKGWTANFNGENVRIDIEPWKPKTRFEISFDFLINENHNTLQHFFCSDSDSNPVMIGINSSNLIFWIIPDQKVFLDDLEIQNTKIKVPLGKHNLRVLVEEYPNSDSTDKGIARIGSGNDGKECFKGNITNLKFKTDKTELYYPLVSYSDTEPATRILIEENTKDGIISTTSETGNWINYPKLTNGLLTYIEGAYFAVKIRGKFKTKPDGEFQYYHGIENTKVILKELDFESDWLFGDYTNNEGRYGIYNNSGSNIELEYIEVLTGRHGKMMNFPESDAFIETNERPILCADPKSIAEWTVNYDDKVYVPITSIRFENDWEISFELGGVLREGWNTILSGSNKEEGVQIALSTDETEIKHGLIIRRNSSSSDLKCFKYQSKEFFPSDFYRGKRISIIKKGTTVDCFINSLKLEMTGSILNNLIVQIDTIGKDIDFSGNDDSNPFEGQISNLKLIDYSDSENCRFYKGTIYSNTDPEAINVQIPNTNILKDEYGTEEIYITSLNTLFKYREVNIHEESEKIIDFSTEKEGNGLYNRAYLFDDDINPISASIYSEIEFEVISGVVKIGYEKVNLSNYFLIGDYGQGKYHFKAPLVWKGGDNTGDKHIDHVITFYATEPLPLRMKITKIIHYKTTHGTVQNLNTVRPYLPLLGNRECFCTNFSEIFQDKQYVRGLSLDKNCVLIKPEGMPTDKSIPEGTLFIKEGLIIKLTYTGLPMKGIYYNGNKDQIQKAFQYPNVFKVVKPTDPDFEGFRIGV